MAFIRITIEIPDDEPIDHAFEKVKTKAKHEMLNLPGKSPMVKIAPAMPERKVPHERRVFTPTKKIPQGSEKMPSVVVKKPGKSIMTREKKIPFNYKGDLEFKQTTKKWLDEIEEP